MLHPRAVRRHAAGGADFAAALAGRTVTDVRRRGKYLWLALDSGDAVVGHLGMSGQMLLLDASVPPGPHLRVRFTFTDGGPQLRFVDQRTFGGLALSPGGGAAAAPRSRTSRRDPFDPAFDPERFVAALRRRRTGVKRALLDQTLISGVGNIYADESLWRARLHGARPATQLTRPAARRLLGHVTDVMRGGAAARAAPASTRSTSTSTARAATSTGRWRSTAGRACRACGAARRSGGSRS